MQSEPIHRQLERLLREQIASGELPGGSALPPELELCRRFGISRSTVRQALGHLVAAGLIRREAGRGTFVSRHAPPVTAPVAHTIGLVVTRLGGMFLAEILSGIHAAVAPAGFGLTVEASEFHPRGEERALERVRSRGVAGILVEPNAVEPGDGAVYGACVADGVPVVFFDRYRPEVPAPWVASDNVRGGREVAAHLLRLGRRRLAYVLPDAAPTSVGDRIRGARWALLESGEGADDLPLIRVGGPSWQPPGPGVRAALTLVFGAPGRASRPDALMCANDDLAMETLGVLRQMGLEVPRDVAVTGFDDLPFARHLHPSLTTVRQDGAAIGRIAAETLLRVLAHPHSRPAPVRVPVQIQVRASTAGTDLAGAADPAPEVGMEPARGG